MARSTRTLRRVLGAGVLLWLCFVAFLVIQAYGKTRDGMEVAQGIPAVANQAGFESGELENSLSQSSHFFGGAHKNLTNPAIVPLRYVPILGTQLRSAEALTDSATTLTRTGNSTVKDVKNVVPDVNSNRALALRRLAEITATCDAQLRSLDFGPSSGIAGPLETARNQLVRNVNRFQPTLTRTTGAFAGLADLFGNERKYLLIAANNAEMRAGSGRFLSVGLLETGASGLELSGMESVASVRAPRGTVTWPEELAQLSRVFPNTSDMSDLMLSPRFEVSAPQAAGVWEKARGTAVDGVLAVDPVALQAVLAATGPVRVNGKVVDSKNVLETLLVEQYRALDSTAGAQAERREALSDAAASVFRTLGTGNWQPVSLLRELGKAANGRHVMAWSKDPGINAHWAASGADGNYGPNTVSLAVLNTGQNKLDQFLRVRASLSKSTSAGRNQFDVSVDLRNTAPSGLPRYVAGPTPGTGLVAGEYAGMLALYVPMDAEVAASDENATGVFTGTDGPTRFQMIAVRLKAGESRTVSWRFFRSSTAQNMVIEPSARLPAVNWDLGGASTVDDHRIPLPD